VLVVDDERGRSDELGVTAVEAVGGVADTAPGNSPMPPMVSSVVTAGAADEAPHAAATTTRPLRSTSRRIDIEPN